ncbi:hypothetical protein MITS9508_01786 [Synechococcus sp. MIT S9508]|nr:hypothetical protein MITS9508_01786 [Synechococcus sp. MIT S9508]
MRGLVHFFLADTGVWTLLLALLLGALQTRQQWTLSRWSEASLLWIAFWVLGVGGVYGFIMHLVFGSFLAEQIGWPNSPFQYEVAYANLTIGILGFSSFLYRKRDYLLASMVAFASWFFADGIGHVASLVVDQNNAPSNAGSVLYTDLLTPLLVLLLLWISRGERRRLS